MAKRFPVPGESAYEVFICYTDHDDPRRQTKDLTTVHLADHGTFKAYTSDVAHMVSNFNKREMISEIRGYWPDVFTRKELTPMPAYVLATILRQSF